MTIFEDFTIAISQPSRYNELLKRKKSAYVLFIFILVFLTSLANVVYPSVTAIRTAKEYYEYKIPDFKIEDGELYTQKEFILDEKPFLIKLSDKKDFSEKDTKGYKIALLCGKSTITVKSNSTVISSEYKEAGKDFKFAKKDIYDYKDAILGAVAVTDILLFGFSFAVFLFGAFLIRLLTKSLLKMLKLELSKEEHFRLCVYSRTLPSLLSAVLVLLNFGSLYIASLMVSVVYIYRVLINMKENQKTDIEE